MAEERVQRRLAAILAADVVGYSGLMEANEEATLQALKICRQTIDQLIDHHEGRIFGTAGDSVMAEFGSAVEAVRAAIAIQEKIKARNTQLSHQGMTFRIGVNLGDVMVEGENLYGDGVNVAARIEGLCAPGEVLVSDMVHRQVESKLSVGFEDKGQHTVKNIAKPVRVYQVISGETLKVDSTGDGEPLPLPDKPSIAVLPFQNMSGDPEQEYFSDGITEDIITELSKLSGLFVIARNSSFVYKGKPVSVKQVGEELGVRYVLEGSVRKAGNRLRITAQLINAPTDHHVWVDRFDRDLEDIFAVQDEVARKVAEELEVALTPSESGRLAQQPTANMEAYDLYLRARTTTWPPTRRNILSARAACERVIEIDPTFAGGYAGRSLSYSMAVLWSHSDDPTADSREALALARQAVEIGQDFARSHSALGFAYSAAGQHEEAVAAARRAIELQPGDADSHAYYARCLVWASRSDEACDEMEIALRLDPQYFDGPYLNMFGRAAFLSGRYEDAAKAFERNAAWGGPSYLGQLLVWCATCGLTGRTAQGRELLEELLREEPGLRLDNVQEFRFNITDHELQKVREGLRLVGFPGS